MPSPAEESPALTPVRWYNSLMWRVALLCAVLLVCLFLAVYIISNHYLTEVVQEMEQRAAQMADRIHIERGQLPSHDVELPGAPNEQVRLKEWKGKRQAQTEIRTVTLNGQVIREAQVILPSQDQWAVVTIRTVISPPSEILRALSRPYMAAVALVFILALGLMVYFIIRILKPITDLSASCAAISRGRLRDVEVRNGVGEIRALEQTFNRMVGSLREKEIMEANLRQAQRLTAIGNLAAGVAHDIRNPLNSIKLLSSHALDTLQSAGMSDGPAQHLQTIRQEVDRLEDIVSRFLSLAREREIQPEPVALDPLLESCVELLRKDAEERHVRLSAELRAGDTVLNLDPELWRRAVLNVLINALEACPPGGRVRLFSRITENSCEIEVRDDGLGMSKGVAERAFEPYFTTKNTGTGLGLAITRGVVEEHGGRIGLSCVEGQGCQVLITIPLEGRKM